MRVDIAFEPGSTAMACYQLTEMSHSLLKCRVTS
jgi:hypothetical protein